ncbi:hypothetical protein EJB05_11398, partial [Eragrostis curvula]
MERIRLPQPSVTFRASALDDQWGIHCFPLADRKVLFDADTRHVVTMPSLHKPKTMPFSLFVPSADDTNSDAEYDPEDDYVEDGVGTLYVMEGSPKKEPVSDQPSEQFEAYVHGQRSETSFKAWDCHLLPPPPYVRDPSKRCPLVTSYGVVGDGGSHIVVSAEGGGTCVMDTASRTWEEIGSWLLPFHGKEAREPQLVCLGSGRFCVARFFETFRTTRFGYDDEVIDREFAVFTGVEVVPRVRGSDNGNGRDKGNNGKGKAKLQMITHVSRCHISANGTTVESVF